jgi:hypothetical protein
MLQHTILCRIWLIVAHLRECYGGLRRLARSTSMAAYVRAVCVRRQILRMDHSKIRIRARPAAKMATAVSIAVRHFLVD